jgi:hypothetical protein
MYNLDHDWKKIVSLCLIALLLGRWIHSANPQAAPARKILFAVWPGQKLKQPASPILDPIAVVSKSDFEQPLKYGDAQGKEAERLYVAFEKKYLSAGQKYPLLFGRHDVGVVEVQAAVGISLEAASGHLMKQGAINALPSLIKLKNLQLPLRKKRRSTICSWFWSELKLAGAWPWHPTTS